MFLGGNCGKFVVFHCGGYVLCGFKTEKKMVTSPLEASFYFGPYLINALLFQKVTKIVLFFTLVWLVILSKYMIR